MANFYNKTYLNKIKKADLIEMFLHQAVGQFELWTGQPAPIDTMRNILTSHFS